MFFLFFFKALESFSMIQPDDKVLVCLSGGKDSLSLLHTLHQYQYYSRSKNLSFSLGAVTVDPLSTSYDPRPLIPYLKSLGIPYFYEEQGNYFSFLLYVNGLLIFFSYNNNNYSV